MAVCLVNHENVYGLASIRKGEFVTVSRVDNSARKPGGEVCCGLQFHGKLGLPRFYYESTYFMKVTPPREMIAEERKVEVPA